VLVGKVRHELLLLLGDGFPLCRAHAPSRGGMMEMGIVQNTLLGLVEHMRQRAMHRGGGATWTCRSGRGHSCSCDEEGNVAVYVRWDGDGTGDGRLSDCDCSIEVVVAQLQLGVERKGNQETCCTEQWGTTKCRKGSLGFGLRSSA